MTALHGLWTRPAGRCGPCLAPATFGPLSGSIQLARRVPPRRAFISDSAPRPMDRGTECPSPPLTLWVTGDSQSAELDARLGSEDPGVSTVNRTSAQKRKLRPSEFVGRGGALHFGGLDRAAALHWVSQPRSDSPQLGLLARRIHEKSGTGSEAIVQAV